MNTSKVITDRYIFDAYGNDVAPGLHNTTEGNSLRFRWNGSSGYRNLPGTNVLHVGARHYSPQLRRWLQRDPMDYTAGDPNLYCYVFNDPVNNFDPDGTQSGGKEFNPDKFLEEGLSTGQHPQRKVLQEKLKDVAVLLTITAACIDIAMPSFVPVKAAGKVAKWVFRGAVKWLKYTPTVTRHGLNKVLEHIAKADGVRTLSPERQQQVASWIDQAALQGMTFDDVLKDGSPVVGRLIRLPKEGGDRWFVAFFRTTDGEKFKRGDLASGWITSGEQKRQYLEKCKQFGK